MVADRQKDTAEDAANQRKRVQLPDIFQRPDTADMVTLTG
jgi:hypothetical protein